MKILVCITCVPDTTSKITFINNDTELNKAGLQYIIGPYDDYALARAVEIKEQIAGTTVTVLNVGLAVNDAVIRKALAIGADDAIRIDAEPTDAYFVANQITEIAQKNNYDLILMGRESTDYNGGQVHGMVGQMLNIPSLSPVMKLEIAGNVATLAREIEGGKEYMEANLPLVLGCQEPIAEWKIPNMKGIMSSRTKPLVVVTPTNLEALTQNSKYELPAARSGCKFIAADQAETLIDLLRNEAKVI